MGAIWERRKPTAAQLDFLRELRAKSNMDAAHYLNRRPEDMSRHEVQELIDELRYAAKTERLDERAKEVK